MNFWKYYGNTAIVFTEWTTFSSLCLYDNTEFSWIMSCFSLFALIVFLPLENWNHQKDISLHAYVENLVSYIVWSGLQTLPTVIRFGYRCSIFFLCTYYFKCILSVFLFKQVRNISNYVFIIIKYKLIEACFMLLFFLLIFTEMISLKVNVFAGLWFNAANIFLFNTYPCLN